MFQEELLAVETAKQDKNPAEASSQEHKNILESMKDEKLIKQEEEEDTNEDLKDVLPLTGDFLDPDLVNSIINEDDELTKNAELDALAGKLIML